mmetsp:Transcript_50077/g.117938  ORF Transcript_50077/g.117938 Transcript_50077/m.117938 type:complete len:258 (-) Transcript_50077:557-1330(-)
MESLELVLGGGVLRQRYASPLLDQQPPRPVEEARDAVDAVGVPGLHLLEGAHEHEVEAQGVCADGCHDVVGVDHIALGLGHLDSLRDHADLRISLEHKGVAFLDQLLLLDLGSGHDLGFLAALVDRGPRVAFLDKLGADKVVVGVLVHRVLDRAQDEALVDEALERLLGVHHPAVVQHLVPEARVQQVQHRMLCPPAVQIHGHPVLFDLLVDRSSRVFRVEKAEVVPAGACPLGHRVGLSAESGAVCCDMVHPLRNR